MAEVSNGIGVAVQYEHLNKKNICHFIIDLRISLDLCQYERTVTPLRLERGTPL